MTEIDAEALYWFTSSSGRIEFELPGECLNDIAQSGANDEAVAYWREQEPVASALAATDPGEVRDDLREYGAWDDDQLADDDANLDRFLWCAAHCVAEEVRSGDYAG